MNDIFLNIYGVAVSISTDSDFVYQNLTKDFALFSQAPDQDRTRGVTLQVLRQRPDYDRIPPVDAALHGHGLICYKDNNINYIVYSCDGLLIYDFKNDAGELWGEDENFLYEKAKLTILSRVGELLDLKGLHRIHAFGVSLNEKALICLLPMEAGKTTSIINLLKANPQIKVLADDLCLIDGQGTVYPFLLRVGVRSQELCHGIPDRHITKIDRPYFGIKYLIDPCYFQERLAKPRRLTHILIGKRSFREKTSIDAASKFKCFGPVMESGVFGLGLPQLLEFFIRGDIHLAFQRTGIILTRVIFCLSLLFKAKTYTIRIGTDKTDTCEKIQELLK